MPQKSAAELADELHQAASDLDTGQIEELIAERGWETVIERLEYRI